MVCEQLHTGSLSCRIRKKYSETHHNRHITLQEENFHWNLDFTVSLMANYLDTYSVYYHIFRNLSMTAYIIEILEIKIS